MKKTTNVVSIFDFTKEDKMESCTIITWILNMDIPPQVPHPKYHMYINSHKYMHV